MRIKQREINVYATRYLGVIGSRLEPKPEGSRTNSAKKAAETKTTWTIRGMIRSRRWSLDNSADQPSTWKKARKETVEQLWILSRSKKKLSKLKNDHSSYLSCRTLESVENLGKRFQLTWSRDLGCRESARDKCRTIIFYYSSINKSTVV